MIVARKNGKNAAFLRFWLSAWIIISLASIGATILLIAVSGIASALEPPTLIADRLEAEALDVAMMIDALSPIESTPMIGELVAREAARGLAAAVARRMAEDGYDLGRVDIAVAWPPSDEGGGRYLRVSFDSDGGELSADGSSISDAAVLEARKSGEAWRETDDRRVIVGVPLRSVAATGRGADPSRRVHGMVMASAVAPTLSPSELPAFILSALPALAVLFLPSGLIAGGVAAAAYGVSIRRLRRAAEGFLKGDYSIEGIKDGKDEIGLLSAAVVRLGAALPALLEDRAERGRWEERSRIARGLHDGVKQDLFALSLNAEAIERGARASDSVDGEAYEPAEGDTARMRASARALKEGLRSLAGEIDALIRAISTPPADGESIKALSKGGATLGGASFAREIAVELDKWSRAGAFGRWALYADASLAADQEATAVAVAKEAIANAARHARAETVSVELADGSLRVRDDGLGIDAASNGTGDVIACGDRASRSGMRGGGLGLRLMSERVAASGGTVRVELDPSGKGTLLELCFSRVSSSPLAAMRTAKGKGPMDGD